MHIKSPIATSSRGTAASPPAKAPAAAGQSPDFGQLLKNAQSGGPAAPAGQAASAASVASVAPLAIAPAATPRQG